MDGHAVRPDLAVLNRLPADYGLHCTTLINVRPRINDLESKAVIEFSVTVKVNVLCIADSAKDILRIMWFKPSGSQFLKQVRLSG